MEIIKNLITIGTFIGMFFGGFFYLDNIYSTKLQAAEKATVGVLEQFKTDMSKDRLEQNYLQLINLERQYRALTIQHPTDRNLKNEYDQIVEERKATKQKLDSMRGLK